MKGIIIPEKWNTPLLRNGLVFASIPVVATFVIGYIFKLMFSDMITSMNEMPLDDPERMTAPVIDLIFPFALLSGLIAFAVWKFLLGHNQSALRGAFAGIITVFLCYPILGFAIGLAYPDSPSRLTAAVSAAISLTILGTAFTFWLTYPMGAICGYFIGKRAAVRQDNHQLDYFN